MTSPHKYLGVQLIGELFECNATLLTDVHFVQSAMEQAADSVRASKVQSIFHRFDPFGVSGVIVIQESHFAIHTWPEHQYATIDFFTCVIETDLEKVITVLSGLFQARRSSHHYQFRGAKSEIQLKKT